MLAAGLSDASPFSLVALRSLRSTLVHYVEMPSLIKPGPLQGKRAAMAVLEYTG